MFVKNGNHLPAPAGNSSHRRRSAHLYAFFVATVLVCASLHAQTVAPGLVDEPVKAEEDSSQRVDESEESYRARMELRDQRYREQKRADMIYSTPAGTSKLDQLPEASREHIKQQMREMIIASRQWKPGEDVSDYPYEPSTAAQTDAGLRNQEREAWAEQMEKYQQREAAAYADAQGSQNAQGKAQGDGQEGGKVSTDGRSATSPATAGQSPAKAARKLESYEAPDEQTEEISTAGVSESALSFVQGKGGHAGASEPPAATGLADAADEAAAEDSRASEGSSGPETPPGSLLLSELARLQGVSSAPGDVSGLPSDQRANGSSSTSAAQSAPDGLSQDEPAAQEDDVADPSGTLIIDDLKKLDSDISASGVVQSSTLSGDAAATAASQAMEPGTLDIAELKRLGGNQLLGSAPSLNPNQ